MEGTIGCTVAFKATQDHQNFEIELLKKLCTLVLKMLKSKIFTTGKKFLIELNSKMLNCINFNVQ
jgi:hypothetical protein